MIKEYGQTNTFVSIMPMTKIKLDNIECGVRSTIDIVIVSLENMWTNSYVQMYKVTKQHIFVSKRNSIEKETSKVFDCTR